MDAFRSRCLMLAGLGLALAGAGWIWACVFGTEAWGELRPGMTAASFHAGRGGQGAELPLPGFQVRLESFALAPRHEFRLFAYTHPDGKGGFEPNPISLEVEEGKVLKVPGYQVEVERLIPDAADHGRFQDSRRAPLNPMLTVMLGLGLSEPLGGQLFALDPQRCRQDEPGGRFAVIFRQSAEPGFLAGLKSRLPYQEKVELVLNGQVHACPARPGARLELPGCTLKILRAYPDFAVRQTPGGPEAYTRSQEAREPWLEAELLQGEATPRKLLLCARDPLSSDRLNAPNLPVGMLVHYVRSGEEPQRVFAVFSLEDRQVRLVEEGRVVRHEAWTLEHPFVVAKGLSVTPMALMERAEYVQDFVPAEAKPGAGFEHPVVQVRVAEAGSQASEGGWLEALGPGGVPTAATFLGGKVALVYRARDPEPQDCSGKIRLLGAKGREGTSLDLSLNHPLEVQGFRLELDRQMPDDPAALGLHLVRRPGRWSVFLGLATAILAFLGCFLPRRWRGL